MLLSAAVATETLFEEMKRYVRFTDDDAALLAELRPHAAPQFDRIVADFYERIREHEGAHAVFSGDEQVRKLQRSLARWLDRVCSGPHDEAYFEETAKIGRAHVRVGLPQHYMLTAMALIRMELERIADQAMGPKAPAVRASISRVLDLELAVMLDSYRRDLAERQRRAGELTREELERRAAAQPPRRYESAVALARVLIIGLDAEATIRMFNPEAERVTGFSREEVLGGSFVDVIVPEELRDDHGRLFRSAAAGLPIGQDFLESAVRTRAGKVRDVRWQLAQAASEEHDVALFAIGHDTTDENALAARVRQNEKLAAVGTLAAGLAHEIRNPLNGAYLHLTFLKRGLSRSGIKDEETFEAVRIVGEEIQRLSNLVTDFLDFARPKPLAKKPVSLRATCERMTQMIAADAEAASVALCHEMPRADIVLELDVAKMEQVFLNLLRNAIEAMAPAGGGRLTCRALRQPRAAVIEIEDSGPGLPSPDAPVFDPFFSTKPKGTGLGLAIAHRIVIDHGGTIDVSSRPGRTTFRLTLPLPLSG